MTWRKWFVRGLVFASTASVAAAALVFHYWTNPAMVRREVVAKLSEHFAGADVRLQTAYLRLLDGIFVSELKMVRRDDAGRTVFLYVPRGVIYYDKEQLHDGKLVIRKIQLDRATIRVIRDQNGCWNLAGILSPPRPDVPIPTIVFDRANLVIEDRLTSLPAVEIKNVNLTFINDPLPILNFEAHGDSDLSGPVTISRAYWGRTSDDVSLHLHMPKIPVAAPLLERLAAYCPQVAAHVRTLRATAEMDADFRYSPKALQPWTHEVQARLHQGRMTHESIPFVLENIEAEAHGVNDQITLDKLEANSGPVRVAMTGRGSLADGGNLDAALKMEHLTFTPDLLARLPEELHDIERRYHPEGIFSFIFEIRRHGKNSIVDCMVRPEEMSAIYADFPYRLEHINGLIEHKKDTAKGLEQVTIDLTGYSNNRPVFIQGTVQESKPASFDLHIWANNVVLDDKLCSALEPAHRKLALSFKPAGLADVDAVVHKGAGDQKAQGRYLIRFHDCSACYDLFPYPVENVNGTLDIHPDYWECRDFRGTHKGTLVRCRGGAARVRGENRLRFEIRGSDLAIDKELRAALTPHPSLQTAWAKLSPSGSMDFEAIVNQVSDREPDIEVTVVPQHARLRPAFFPYDLADLRGRVHYHDHLVELDRLQARHGRSAFALEQGKVLLKQAGGVSVNLMNLTASPVVPDRSFHDALPPALAKAVDVLALHDPLALRTNLVIDIPANDKLPPYIYWDGFVDLVNADLHPGVGLEHVTGRIACRGQHQGQFGNVTGNLELQQVIMYRQPFIGVHGRIVVNEAQPDVLLLPSFEAKIFGGDLGGSIRIELGEKPTYEADLTATQMQLEEFGRHNGLNSKRQLKGMAAARLYLKGSGTDVDGLTGAGRLDVENGKMYDLPLLLDLLKFLNFRIPDSDHTAFEDAHARFQIHGPLISITRLDLIGSAITLGGRGTVRVAEVGGDIDMELYAVWAPLEQLTPLPLKPLWPAVSKQFLKIKMKGKIGETPHFQKVPIPPLTEPLKGLIDRMEGKR
jgi:AsmA-like C-terminal region